MTKEEATYLMQKAKAILTDKENWLDTEGWVSQQAFNIQFLPKIDVTLACREREKRTPNSATPLYLKIQYGRARLCRRIEARLGVEKNRLNNTIRLVEKAAREPEKMPVADNPPDDTEGTPASTKSIDEILLAHGGEQVNHEAPGLDGVITQRGELMRPTNIIIKKGVEHNCHRNACGFFIMHHPGCRFVSGYALSHGRWITHSWLLADETIIETTRRFDLYFGVIYDDLQTIDFIMREMCVICPRLGEAVQKHFDREHT